ncbi:hypothetical protein BGZ54_008740 [Gamsiella multidivaricata]|nr:hypothetical protein BGZ54_008740 [Gamsiella multidivaricata]
MDKESVQELFTKRSGAYSLSNEAFSIKATRMPFREPPPPDVPVFVQKAAMEYNYAMTRYNQEQQEQQEKKEQQKQQDEFAAKAPSSSLTPSASSSLSSTTSNLEPPTLPLPILQYQLRNVRLYPESAMSPHPPFRVTFVVPKKTVSKLATHRNLVRKKLTAAVEAVFREHARPGHEFLIFAKRECMTTTQEKLVQWMKRDLTNPALYGGRATRQNTRDSGFSKTDSKDYNKGMEGPGTGNQGGGKKLDSHRTVTVRWKNNRPPLFKKWWKHALPNPLGRTQQSDAYLDQYCLPPQETPSPDNEDPAKLKKQ